jgi:hypothetical protein
MACLVSVVVGLACIENPGVGVTKVNAAAGEE